ncbi:34609_t:CDS:2 [Gigaspora margarita]|uniref:34609_t:CDS:1 n=1 Tax=Gigaspora margarita TaxID=4874 RepID=A0ABN7V1N0_GIGMA|nr:34609_t:CDS:2 [Gigaspora margarita]
MENTVIPIDDNNTYNGKQEEFTTHNGKQDELTPHNREQVTMITCSPNMKNIVTWSDEDNSAVCCKKFGDIKNYFTVSDDKFVSMPISEEEVEIIKEDDDSKINYVKVGIFNFETGENLFLNLPYSEIIVETLAFLDGNNLGENKLIMISKEPLYRIYIFTQENNEFIHQSTIKMETYDEKIFLSNGKLFIYDGNLGSITKWDINTLKFEAFFLFDNSFDVDNMKLSDNGVLLFVYGKKREDNLHKDPYPCISIYSTEHGNKFIAFYLIASDIGARLLIVDHKKNEEEKKYQYHICDPFAPNISIENYVKANKLFEDFEAKSSEIFENKYIIKNDKIIGFNNDGNLVIKGLIPDNDNWISYLRNELKDFNRIFISSASEKIIDLIVKSKKGTDVYKKYPKKFFVTWTLKYDNMNIFLTAEFKNDKIEQTDRIQIVSESYINSVKDVKEFVKECDCLNNDDLVMVTALGVLIWTFNRKNKKIELNYRWDDEGNTWECDRIELIKLFYEIGENKFDEKNLNENNFDIKGLKKKSYFFPPPSYISMIRYNHAHSQSQPPKDDRFFFNELIEMHINNKFFLILYGKKLIEDIIKEDEETLLRKVLNGCIKQIEKDEETLNTQIFKIFSQSVNEIFKNNLSFFEDFVIQISFLCVLKVEKKDQVLNHLNHYQNYIHISELRKFISEINSNDWEESTKPIITKVMKAIKDEKQESEAEKIQKIYTTQETEAVQIQKIQKMLKKVMEKLEIQFLEEDAN